MVQVSWDPPKESHIVVRGYVLSYGKRTPDDSSKNLPNITTKYLLRNLRKSFLKIGFHKTADFRESWQGRESEDLKETNLRKTG